MDSLKKSFVFSIIFVAFEFCSGSLHAQPSFQNHYHFTDSLHSVQSIDAAFDRYNNGMYILSRVGFGEDGAMLMHIGDSGYYTYNKIYYQAGATMLAYRLSGLSDSTLMIMGYISGGYGFIKTDLNGNMILAKKLSAGNVLVTEVFEYDSSFYAVGSISAGFGNPIFMKMDLNANVTWIKTYPPDQGYSETLSSGLPVSDGGYLLTGRGNLITNPSQVYIVLIKTDSSGDILWKRRIYLNLPNHSVVVNDAVETDDGGFLVLVSHFGNANSAFVKTTSTGIPQWQKVYESGTFGLYLQQIYRLHDNAYLSAGEFEITALDQRAGSIVVDSIGDLVAMNVYTSTLNNNFFSHNTEYSPQHGLMITGRTDSGNPWLLIESLYRTDTLFETACSFAPYVLPYYLVTMVDSISTPVQGSSPVLTYDISSLILDTILPVTENANCLISSINDYEGHGIGFNIFPNPVKNELIINSNSVAEVGFYVNLQIINSSGQLMLEDKNYKPGNKIDCHELASGLYAVTLSGTKKQWFSKFIKL